MKILFITVDYLIWMIIKYISIALKSGASFYIKMRQNNVRHSGIVFEG